MREFPEDTALTPGTWYLWKTGKKSVLMSCPLCGGVTQVAFEDVDVDGALVAKFSCRRQACVFDEAIKLKDWKADK